MKITINDDGLVFDGTRDRMVSGAVGTTSCTFELGEHHDLWNGLVITAVWRNGDFMFEQAVTDGQTLTVPHEVLAEPGELFVGVYGVKSDGSVVRPELWCDVGQVLSGVPVGEGKEPTTPTVDQWQAAYLSVRDVVDSELSRKKAETSRQSAEQSRANAEIQRQTNESKRQSTYIRSAKATTLPAGASATADISGNVLTVGIPSAPGNCAVYYIHGTSLDMSKVPTTPAVVVLDNASVFFVPDRGSSMQLASAQ